MSTKERQRALRKNKEKIGSSNVQERPPIQDFELAWVNGALNENGEQVVSGIEKRMRSKQRDAWHGFQGIEFRPTRFLHKQVLEDMGIDKDVYGLLRRLGLGVLMNMDHPIYHEETRDILATIELRYENPKAPNADNFLVTFIVKGREYSLTIREVCEAYEFPYSSETRFQGTQAFEDFCELVLGESFGHNSKMSTIRNPAVRYTIRLIANAMFPRRETNSLTYDEAMLLFKGLKHIVRNKDGNLFEDNVGNPNYAILFIKSLMRIRSWVKLGVSEHIHVGGFLIRLMLKAGICLTHSIVDNSALYMDREYLATTHFLSHKGPEYYYLFLDSSREKKCFILPNQAQTHLLSPTNVLFSPNEDELVEIPTSKKKIKKAQAPTQELPQHESTTHQTSSPRFDMEKYHLPPLPFKPKTAREKLLHVYCKAQDRINKFQSKVISKLLGKMKKIQPPSYISSDESEEVEDENAKEDLEWVSQYKEDEEGNYIGKQWDDSYSYYGHGSNAFQDGGLGYNLYGSHVGGSSSNTQDLQVQPPLDARHSFGGMPSFPHFQEPPRSSMHEPSMRQSIGEKDTHIQYTRGKKKKRASSSTPSD